MSSESDLNKLINNEFPALNRQGTSLRNYKSTEVTLHKAENQEYQTYSYHDHHMHNQSDEPIESNSETQALINDDPSDDNNPNKRVVKKGLFRRMFPFGFWQELKKLLQLALPITATSVISFLSGPISLIFIGRLGKTALAAVGLANSVFNVLGLAIVTGLLTAADTIFTQTYGSSYKQQLGVELQKAFVITSFCCIPCWCFYLCSEPILILLKQSPVVAKSTANYLLYMIPALYFAAMGQIFVKYIQAQNQVYIPLVIGLISNGFNALMHYLLLFVWNTGAIGSAIAQTSAYLFQFVCFVVYVLLYARTELNVQKWSVTLWHNWGSWFKLALPGIVMITLEWTIFEVGSIVSGTLGEKELATQTIIFNIESILYTLLPLGFGIATSIRVGQLLGAGSSDGPRSIIFVALITLWLTSVVVIIILLSLKWQIPKIFTSEPDVIELTAQLLLFIAVFQIFDGTVGVCSGAVRGAGLQMVGAIITFLSLYIIGAPLGLSLVFIYGYGLEGLWIGLTIGLIVQATAYLLTCIFVNWDKQVEHAFERTRLNTNVSGTENNQNHVDATNFDPTSFATSYSTEVIVEGETDSDYQHNGNYYNAESSHLNLNGTNGQSADKRKIIMYRTIFIAILLLLLVLSALLRVYRPWSNKLGEFCLFENGSYITINGFQTNSKTFTTANCTILIP